MPNIIPIPNVSRDERVGSAFYRLSKDRDEVVELPKTIRWDGTIVLMRIPVTLPNNFNFYNYIQ